MGSRHSHAAPSEFICFFAGNAALLNNIPLLPGEPTGAGILKTRFDLRSYNMCRQQIYISAAGLANCELMIQYSTDDVTWRDLSLHVNAGSIGRKYTAWSLIPARARGDVYLRVAGQGGDGVTDLTMSAWYLEIR